MLGEELSGTPADELKLIAHGKILGFGCNPSLAYLGLQHADNVHMVFRMGSGMEFSVTTLSGLTFNFDVSKATTVNQLKLMMAEEGLPPPERQRLVLDGRILEGEDDRLTAVGVARRSQLHVVLVDVHDDELLGKPRAKRGARMMG